MHWINQAGGLKSHHQHGPILSSSSFTGVVQICQTGSLPYNIASILGPGLEGAQAGIVDEIEEAHVDRLACMFCNDPNSLAVVLDLIGVSKIV